MLPVTPGTPSHGATNAPRYSRVAVAGKALLRVRDESERKSMQPVAWGLTGSLYVKNANKR